MNGITFKGDYFKFFIYGVVIVLINIASVTLFFRVDLTKNNLYSLSDASYSVVKTLSEPLTIKVFFTKNLPAPHNTTERYLHDLLEEYSSTGGRFFNYSFYDVTSSEAGLTQETDRNRKLAEDYGISPVQIRLIENDEIKFQQAYMGLVIIHGDMIEKIPALTSTDGLEYKLTTAIQKLNNKVSTLVGLKDKVVIRMFLSSSLYGVAPLMGLNQLSSLPEQIASVVEDLNRKNLDKIDYQFIDPSREGNLEEIVEKYNLLGLSWPEVPQQNIHAGSGASGIVIQYKDRIETLPVITSVNLPILGTTYQMTDPETLGDILSETMESMIGINQTIGYLASHGTPTISTLPMGMMPGQPQGVMNTFNQLVSNRYSIKEIQLKEDGISEGLDCLIIARPTEAFSDYDLFQIDQALMKGTNLAVFADAFNEIMPAQAGGFGGGPQYVPLDTGLERLLEHYGVTIKKSFVMDENCYKQVVQGRLGNEERNIYFAPMIEDKNINNTPGFMKSIKGLVAMKISPLVLDEDRVKTNHLEAVTLFSSSEKSWEMKDDIQLNPMFIQPPSSDKDKMSYPLAIMLSGEFPSYFAGKELPQKESSEADVAEEKPPSDASVPGLAGVEAENRIIERGKPGKVLVLACSSMLQDTMLDPEGRTTNATFILNVIDHLNHHDDTAAMRSKNQRLNPLEETSPVARGFIKGFNIAGLPLLVVLFGFGVWIKRRSRMRHIKAMFQKEIRE